MQDYQSIPLIDLKFGISQLGGNEALYQSLLSRFVTEYESVPDKIKATLDKNDRESCRVQVHTLKGVAGNMGLSRLHKACTEAQSAIKNDDDMAEPVECVLNCFNLSVKAISEYQSTHSESSESQVHLTTLKQKLQNNEFVATEYVKVALSECQLSDSKKQELIQVISDLEYDKALNLLNDL
ncbi:Hpt domain-containing protein [Aestuariibacter sp. AA17]|uniref:Hpt domain-containing protein n=1 Tax=Fluctibacter corallii TaxID=2984329 RepID=A0ABT3A355_9ALTE|nr:Hpt domain-containing protein [Aestuariibacter sp. AA17]MCV2883107.1 Hpt domain-containing protein [Aestuariibacter sp. AA17]